MVSHTVDASLVKRGHTKNTYDLYKLKELKRCIKDPVYFLENYMKIQHPVKGAIDFKPYDYQRELIELYAFNRSSIALLPRQSGKCVEKSINIDIRNKNTGEVKKIAIGDYFNFIKGNKNE